MQDVASLHQAHDTENCTVNNMVSNMPAATSVLHDQCPLLGHALLGTCAGLLKISSS